MGQVVSLTQHQATKQTRIREAERRAKGALHQASLAYKELHRLRSDRGVRLTPTEHLYLPQAPR
jgi:hypothetical protein